MISMSHPTWVRGLKHVKHFISPQNSKSHPTWVRGLKLVATLFAALMPSRTLRGCVD